MNMRPRYSRQQLREDVRQMMGFGFGLALLSSIPLAVWIIRRIFGASDFEPYSMFGVAVFLLSYPAAGIVDGIVIWLLRPARSHPLGWGLTGMIALPIACTCVFAGVDFAVRAGVEIPPVSQPIMDMLGVIVFACVGFCSGMLIWAKERRNVVQTAAAAMSTTQKPDQDTSAP